MSYVQKSPPHPPSSISVRYKWNVCSISGSSTLVVSTCFRSLNGVIKALPGQEGDQTLVWVIHQGTCDLVYPLTYSHYSNSKHTRNRAVLSRGRTPPQNNADSPMRFSGAPNLAAGVWPNNEMLPVTCESEPSTDHHQNVLLSSKNSEFYLWSSLGEWLEHHCKD